MPNKPKPADENRTSPDERSNAQGNHEGSSHSPEEFTKRKSPAPKDGKD